MPSSLTWAHQRRRRAPRRGLGLIEQLAAISVAGTLGAGAMTTLAALDAQARATALARLAASAATAMALNQAGCLLTGQRSTPGRCQPVGDCTDVRLLLMNGLPEGYAVRSQPLSPTGTSCQLQRLQDGAVAGFHGVAAGR